MKKKVISNKELADIWSGKKKGYPFPNQPYWLRPIQYIYLVLYNFRHKVRR